MDIKQALERVEPFEVTDLRPQVALAGRRWDAVARLRVGKKGLNLAIEEKRWPDARWAELFVRQWGHGTLGGRVPVVLASYLGPAIRRSLEAGGIGWVDQNGSAHLESEGILVHVERPLPRGAVPRPRGRLFSPRGRHVAQALLERPAGPHTLASLANDVGVIAPSTVSRSLDRLEIDGLVERGPEGWFVPSPAALLDAWLEASLRLHGPEVRGFFHPEPPSSIMRQLSEEAVRSHDVRCLLTGLSAAELIEPLIAAHRVDAYVFPPMKASRLASSLRWVPTEESPNVTLLLSSNDGPTIGEHPIGRNLVVGRAQLILDLMREGGRALQVVEALRKAWQL